MQTILKQSDETTKELLETVPFACFHVSNRNGRFMSCQKYGFSVTIGPEKEETHESGKDWKISEIAQNGKTADTGKAE